MRCMGVSGCAVHRSVILARRGLANSVFFRECIPALISFLRLGSCRTHGRNAMILMDLKAVRVVVRDDVAKEFVPSGDYVSSTHESPLETGNRDTVGWDGVRLLLLEPECGPFDVDPRHYIASRDINGLVETLRHKCPISETVLNAALRPLQSVTH